MRAHLAMAILVIPMVAGCLTGDDSDDPMGSGSGSVPSSPMSLDGNTVVMEVPVPVFLIGFDEGMADSLQDRLQSMHLQPNGALDITARFQVHAPDDAWQTDFDAFLATATLAGHADVTGFNGAILDGNAIEAYFVDQLASIHPVPNGLTSLVIIDAGLRGHAYHYDGDVGWREPVRAFGEHSSLLIWDPHAEPDPWAGIAQPHHVPMNAPSAGDIGAWVERATAIRALQMPIWPPATLTCHAITVILAVRGTSVTPTVLGLQDWDETLDMDALQSTFQNLTGDPVHVDLVVLQLPQDDPALEATTRENNARVITQTYLDMNFDTYHVAHDGCEPYLSLVVFGDLADQRTSSNGNAAMMGASGNRISTSLVAENVRIMSEVIGYQQQWDESTNFERVGPGASPTAWFDWVVSHETGHLFSLPHPNYSTGTPSYSDTGFAATWNVMGYQMRRIVTETSVVDSNNFQRHQAAYSLLEADGSGIDGNVIDAALQAMGEYRWKDATRLLADG